MPAVIDSSIKQHAQLIKYLTHLELCPWPTRLYFQMSAARSVVVVENYITSHSKHILQKQNKGNQVRDLQASVQHERNDTHA